MVDAAEARFGRIDVLVHLVGGWAGGIPVADLDPDVLRTMLDQHLWTTLHVAQAARPRHGRARLRARARRDVAVRRRTRRPKGASYAIAKAAEELLLRSLARETAATGVTVNLVVVRTIDLRHERETRRRRRTRLDDARGDRRDPRLRWPRRPPRPSPARGSRSTAGLSGAWPTRPRPGGPGSPGSSARRWTAGSRPPTASSRWISSQAAREDAHRLRAAHDAVLVGSGAARIDDPHLGLRHGVARPPAAARRARRPRVASCGPRPGSPTRPPRRSS